MRRRAAARHSIGCAEGVPPAPAVIALRIFPGPGRSCRRPCRAPRATPSVIYRNFPGRNELKHDVNLTAHTNGGTRPPPLAGGAIRGHPPPNMPRIESPHRFASRPAPQDRACPGPAVPGDRLPLRSCRRPSPDAPPQRVGDRSTGPRTPPPGIGGLNLPPEPCQPSSWPSSSIILRNWLFSRRVASRSKTRYLILSRRKSMLS